MIRIVSGFPVESDIVSLLENFCETARPPSRPSEIYLRSCPLCKDEDARGTNPQGAISYSLEKHCLVCAKCGKSVGWKELLQEMNAEWERPDAHSVDAGTSEGISVLADLAREAARAAGPPQSDGKKFVDHGDYGVDVVVAAEHHARRLMADGSRVREWLEGRGFSFADDYAENPGEAWAGECKAGWFVSIYRNADGSVRGFKYRNIDTKEFEAQKGVQSIPYGIHRLDAENPTVTFIEAEIDCETLVQIYGVKNVFSLPNGGNSWNAKFGKYAAHATTLFVATDDDEVGEVGASKIFVDAPASMPNVTRAKRVYFSVKSKRIKDANDAWKAGATLDDIRSAFASAEDPDVTAAEQIEKNVLGEFVRTGWISVDEVLGGGLLIGEVTHLAGSPKSGKTTLVLSLHQDLAIRGVRSAFVPLDMNAGKIAIRMGMGLLGKTDADFYRTAIGSGDRDGFIAVMDEAMKSTFKGNLLLSKQKRISSYREALAVIERMGKSGAKLITVEDYLSLAVMYERESKNRSTFSGRQIVTDLADVAERCRSHIVLINHLKTDDKAAQAYGAGQIGASAQSNIHVHADRDQNGKTKATIMHIRENRFNSTADVDISFSFSDTDRVLVAGGFKAHAKKGKKSKQIDGHDY